MVRGSTGGGGQPAASLMGQEVFFLRGPKHWNPTSRFDNYYSIIIIITIIIMIIYNIITIHNYYHYYYYSSFAGRKRQLLSGPAEQSFFKKLFHAVYGCGMNMNTSPFSLTSFFSGVPIFVCALEGRKCSKKSQIPLGFPPPMRVFVCVWTWWKQRKNLFHLF